MDNKSDHLNETINITQTSHFLPIVLSLFVILISFVIYFLKNKTSRQSILLIGLSEAGKTTLFSQLAHDSFVSTVTSMKENESEITVKDNKTLTLVDLPGFDRLRNQYWEKFKSRSKGVIYVIDSLKFMSNAHNVADLLYQYLCDNVVMSNRLPILVACTKQDETRAKSSKVISSILEKEFNTIRETRLGALDSTGGENNRQILGDSQNPFKFNDLKNQITFVDCSASKDQKNLESILKWINSIA